MMKNLHKAYYKDYFDGVDFNYLLTQGQKASKELVAEMKRRNNRLCANGLLKNIDAPVAIDEKSKFCLKVAYPGLVTGIGITHEAKIEGEFKLGVHFDYTHGMPVVYGSSVKGVLRAYFEDFYKGDDKEDLVKDIFCGKGKSIYDRDIFFDAVIVNADSKGRILCSDSITPHGDDPLKNPIPITFMKIAPGCTLEFRFKLVDSKVNNQTYSADEKLKLFKEILTTVGIGAKTNIGYGQLEET